ncbi:hypothetical protein K431DRAFT_340899 [Polychaeton citri CBS 116435]|uniref:GATA-type domain-containing protein n=1 Tax=Polychaeton citri CBS 116435 TaxID=1314669 RepID=A0A9P4Q030_9PEZI|nr:hypothetical protein K431DRAFT_340899 [Polychaeton citri CBS 116435]
MRKPNNFVHKQDWSHEIVENLSDLLLVLAPSGRILYASPSCIRSIIGKPTSEYVHPDDLEVFLDEFYTSIKRGKRHDGTYVVLEWHGHPHTSPSTIERGNDGFFVTARPCLTKNAILLDSLLHHRTENERLGRRLAQNRSPKRCRSVDVRSSLPHTWRRRNPAALMTVSSRQSHDSTPSTHDTSTTTPVSQGKRPYNRIEYVELLTGLHYGDGERSSGISTGDRSPDLTHIAATTPRSSTWNERCKMTDRQNVKPMDGHKCISCTTTDSPEWRRGPKGPKTLCNACGLRWIKQERKKKMKLNNGNVKEKGQQLILTPVLQATPV